MRCKKCGGEMISSTAIEQTYTAGVPDFPGMDVNSPGQTISPGGPGKHVPCWKCVDCGWSVTKGDKDDEI